MSRNSLGIMTRIWGEDNTFSEKAYYRQLTRIGRKWGIRVFVFSPKDVDFDKRQIDGYEYRRGAWKPGRFGFPQTVYDRCFVGPRYHEYKPLVERLRQDPAVIFLSRGLSGKWQVHLILDQSPELAGHLPETQMYSHKALRRLLERDQAAIAKPAAGTHGAGVVLITANGRQYRVKGRSRDNRLFDRECRSLSELNRIIHRLTRNRAYLLQQYLPLRTPEGHPFDVRVLVQKDGEGKWQTTGAAVRVGPKHAITSNLHGGGKAQALGPFLHRWFVPQIRHEIENTLDEIARKLPPYLEANHGRLLELGIDLGIDPSGKVWILEVNSRPGRNVFRQINDERARIRSIEQPILYARYLMKERVGGY